MSSINSELSTKIKKTRKAVGMTQNQTAEKMGVSLSSYQSYEAGRTMPPADFIFNFVKLTQVNPAWFIGDIGSMFTSEDEVYSAEPTTIKESLVYLPVLGQIKAGKNGTYIDDTAAEYYLPLPQGHPKNHRKLISTDRFGFEISGDSMFPIYRQGDVVVCAPQIKHPVKPDDHVVAQSQDGETFCKIWRPIGNGKVQLVSYNKDYTPIELDKKEITDVARIVDIVWAWRARDLRIDPDEMNALENNK